MVDPAEYLKTLTQPLPERVPSREARELAERIYDEMEKHAETCCMVNFEDEDGGAYPVIDMLSGNNSSIEVGVAEIRNLVEHVAVNSEIINIIQAALDASHDEALEKAAKEAKARFCWPASPDFISEAIRSMRVKP